MRYKLFFILILLIPWVSCKQKKAEKETLKDDFELIKERKELTILTLYSSTSYFLYKGEEMGYEYELIKQFAEDNGLKLKVIVAENIGKLIEMLKAGKGDIIAYDIPITGDLKKEILHCGHGNGNKSGRFGLISKAKNNKIQLSLLCKTAKIGRAHV